MALTLEQEFNKRKFEVMTSVVSAVTMKCWYDKQMQGVTIPTFLVDKQELQYKASVVAEGIVKKLLENGELEQAFNESWATVAELLP